MTCRGRVGPPLSRPSFFLVWRPGKEGPEEGFAESHQTFFFAATFGLGFLFSIFFAVLWGWASSSPFFPQYNKCCTYRKFPAKNREQLYGITPHRHIYFLRLPLVDGLRLNSKYTLFIHSLKRRSPRPGRIKKTLAGIQLWAWFWVPPEVQLDIRRRCPSRLSLLFQSLFSLGPQMTDPPSSPAAHIPSRSRRCRRDTRVPNLHAQNNFFGEMRSA